MLTYPDEGRTANAAIRRSALELAAEEAEERAKQNAPIVTLVRL